MLGSQEQQQMLNLIKQLPLDKNMISMCNAIHDRLDDDKDVVIAIDGEERIGKSTLSILLGFILDNRFDLEKNVAYLPTANEIESKFRMLKSKQYFSVDEAVKAFYKLHFMDRLQVRINEMYATEGWQNKITSLCIPRFTDLNEYFRNHRVKFWIKVIDRGKAIAFAKDEINDMWHLKEEYVKTMYRKNLQI